MTTAISRHEPSPRATLILLGLILLAAALLRLPTLGAQSFRTDEGATWIQVSGSLADVIARTAADNYPPLFNLLAWACVQALILLAALGIASVVRSALAALLASAAVLLLSILTLAFVSPANRADWRGAAACVKSSATPTDCIILADTAVLKDNQNFAVWNSCLRQQLSWSPPPATVNRQRPSWTD